MPKMTTARVRVVPPFRPSASMHVWDSSGDMIYHSPPFLLVLDYTLKTWIAEDRIGLFLASQHLPRVTEVVLSMPELSLATLTTGLIEAALSLCTLIQHSQTSEIVLPKQFLEDGAPQLRHLILTGAAALSPLQPVLSSATSLVSSPSNASQVLHIFHQTVS
jgi:hypothetical protein